MRRLVLLAPLACLAVAACSSNQTAPPSAPGVPPAAPAPSRSVLLGMTRGEVAQHFGLPDFAVQEGPGTKVQYRAKACVLDLYLYPPVSGGGEARVTHVDTRDREGRNVGQASCVATIVAH